MKEWTVDYAIPAAASAVKAIGSTVKIQSPTSFGLSHDAPQAVWMFFVCWDHGFNETFAPMVARALACRLPTGASLETTSFRIPAHPKAVDIMRRESLRVVVPSAWLLTPKHHFLFDAGDPMASISTQPASITVRRSLQMHGALPTQSVTLTWLRSFPRFVCACPLLAAGNGGSEQRPRRSGWRAGRSEVR